MLNKAKVSSGVKGLRAIATKETENPDPNKAVAEALGIETEVVARIVAESATEADLVQAAGGIIRIAAQVGPEDGEAAEVATKSFGSVFGDDANEDGNDNRDAHGVSLTKPYGSTPGDMIARKRAEIARWGDLEDEGRAADGRSARKVFS